VVRIRIHREQALALDTSAAWAAWVAFEEPFEWVVHADFSSDLGSVDTVLAYPAERPQPDL
jgi:hypothetical protein